MPLTAIDPTAVLVRTWRQHGLPVVLVSVTGSAPGRTDAGRGGRGVAPARYSLERVFPQLGETATSAEITGWLDRQAASHAR